MINELVAYLTNVIDSNPINSVFGLGVVLLITCLFFNIKTDGPKKAKGDEDL